MLLERDLITNFVHIIWAPKHRKVVLSAFSDYYVNENNNVCGMILDDKLESSDLYWLSLSLTVAPPEHDGIEKCYLTSTDRIMSHSGLVDQTTYNFQVDDIFIKISTKGNVLTGVKLLCNMTL